MSDFGFASTATDLSSIQQTISDLEVEGPDTGALRRLPRVGEVINDTYCIESVRGPRRYVARHRWMNELYELRILNWISTRSEELPEVEVRVRAASLVGNPNLAATVDFGACRTFGTYGVLELVSGTSLKQMFESDGPVALDEVVRFALEVGAALGSVHEIGVAHGIVDLDDFVLAEDGVWKVLAAGFPAPIDAVWALRAPELEDPEHATPSSDQWAFAAILYQMLVGNAPVRGETRAPGRRRADVPDQLDEAIMRGLRPAPEERWPQMEAILEALQRGFHRWRQPSMVPMDAREVSRLLKLHPDVAGSFDRERTRQSVVVRVGDLRQAKPTLAVSFRNVARLRREYRHNLAHGGLFVPTNDPPLENTEVTVLMEIATHSRKVELNGIVANVAAGDDTTPPGAGIVFDAPSVERLLGFLREVGVVKGLRPGDVVIRTADFGALDQLGAEELFLYSMIMGAPRVSHLRSECASLPFDFEEMLQSLVDRGAIVVEAQQPVNARMPSRPETRMHSAIGALRLGADDLEFLLEQVEFHEDRRSFLAALALLDKALQHMPEEPRLHHKRALVLARGMNDLIAAKGAAKRAVELDSRRREFKEALNYIDGLIERDAIRCEYHREFPVTDVELIGWDGRRGCVWGVTRSRLQPDRVRLIGIDVVRDTILHSETADGARDIHFVWDPVAHAGLNPVMWRGRSRPSAVSSDGSLWAFDRDPEGEARGLWIRNANTAEIVCVVDAPSATFDVKFSPESSHVAWQCANGDETEVWMAPIGGAATRVLHSNGVFHMSWNSRGDKLMVFESATGAVWSACASREAKRVGTVPQGFARAVADASRATIALVYPGETSEVVWATIDDGEELARVQIEDAVHDCILREDGCLLARGTSGMYAADLGHRNVRPIPGMRLCANSFRAATWYGGEPFVGMRLRPNAIELTSFRVDIFLA